MILGVRAYIEGVAAILIMGLGLVLWLKHDHAEQQKGVLRVEQQDLDAQRDAQARADAQTEANAIKAALAATGANNEQNAVDAYLAAHPASVPVGAAADHRCGRVPEAGARDARTAGPGPRRPPVPAVLAGQQDRALAEILSSAARLAVIHVEEQQR
jgi:hypothetical protein